MKIDFKKLESQIPSSFHPIFDVIHSRGFIMTLVGGSVRDFFLFGSLGRDWDVELGHETLAFNKTDWKDFGKSLSAFGRVTFLPYDIIRLDLDSYQIELSSPRKEHYHADGKGHSNFDAEFNLRFPFEQAVLRRDFTINAMGLRFKSLKSVEHLDPLGGLAHLKEKILHPAGHDFSKDPVRFLRAYRFRLKYQFAFSPELKQQLDTMNIEGMTPAYLWSEMQKSQDPVSFLEQLLLVKERHPDLKLPVYVTPVAYQKIKKVITDPSTHEAWLIALEWSGIPSETWSSFFSLSSESCRRLARWAGTTKIFREILPESFHGDFEEVRDSENFEKLFDWYFTTKQLLQKNTDLPLLKMIEEFLPDWIHLYKFEPPKDVKHIDPPFRAKYQVWNLCQRL